MDKAELEEIRKRAEAAPLYDERYLLKVTDDYASDFYKHAREDVPKLLAEVERLQLENDEMYDVLDDAYGEILRDKRNRVADIIEEWGDKHVKSE